MMKIVIGRPPEWVWNRAHELFKIDDSCTSYAFGEFLYNPAGLKLPPEILAHEEVHQQQQYAIGGAEPWWIRYFEDPVFRAAQESEAHGKQYQVWCRFERDRNRRALYLHHIAQILAGGMYGINVSVADAKKAIKHASGV